MPEQTINSDAQVDSSSPKYGRRSIFAGTGLIVIIGLVMILSNNPVIDENGNMNFTNPFAIGYNASCSDTFYMNGVMINQTIFNCTCDYPRQEIWYDVSLSEVLQLDTCAQIVTMGNKTMYPEQIETYCMLYEFSNTTDDYVMCDSYMDGNGDGICQDGESCLSIFITEQDNQTLIQWEAVDYYKNKYESYMGSLQ